MTAANHSQATLLSLTGLKVLSSTKLRLLLFLLQIRQLLPRTQYTEEVYQVDVCRAFSADGLYLSKEE